MPPAPDNARAPEPDLLTAYVAHLEATGRGNRSYLSGARSFFARWPNPQDWVEEPLEERLAVTSNIWPLVNFLMYNGHLRPGYDYLCVFRGNGPPVSLKWAAFGRAAVTCGGGATWSPR
jgi:hypothetical protein